MKDRFKALLDRAEQKFAEPNTARLLVSWDHSKEDFELHNLTETHATFQYFTNWQLDPICFIIPSHVQLLRDDTVLEILAQSWHTIIEELSMPPCETPITMPIPTNSNPAQS